MNPTLLSLSRSALLALGLLGAAVVVRPADSPGRAGTPASLDVLRLEVVPPGHYLVNLQAHGPERWLNFKVADGTAVCVNATDPALRGLRGSFQGIGNGVFLVSLANENHRATQFWVFQPDGTARVKEIPDRGETQEARPVRDDSLTRPASRSSSPKP
jgi:hypothetical protein